MKKDVDEGANESYHGRIDKLQNLALKEALHNALHAMASAHKVMLANEIDAKVDISDNEIETLIDYAEKPLDKERENKFNLLLKKYSENSYPILHELGQMLVIVGILAIFTSLILLSVTIPVVASTLLVTAMVNSLLIAAAITGTLGKAAISVGMGMTLWARPDVTGRALLDVREELNSGSYDADLIGSCDFA